MDNDVVKLATGAGVSLTGKLLGRGVHVLGQVILARLLGPTAFGLYAIGWTILRIVGLIAPLGLGRGVIRFAPRYWRASPSGLKGVLFQSLGMAFLSGLVAGALVYWAAPWLANAVFAEPELTSVIRLFSLALPLMTVLRVAAAATRVSQRMQFSVYAQELGQPAANLLLVAAFGLAGFGLLGGVAAAVISFAVALMLALYFVKRLFPEAFSAGLKSPPFAKKLLAFSLPASLGGMSFMLCLWVDRLIVGHFRSASDVGIYQACSQSAMVFAIILSGFTSILSPLIVDLMRKEEKARLEELYRVSTKWGLYMSLMVFLLISSAPYQVLSVVFGRDYAPGGTVLVILAFGQLASAGTGAIGPLMIMTGHQNRWLVLSGSALLLNVALNFLLIPRWGITGAAIATATAITSLSLCGLLQVRRVLKLWPYDRRYFKGLVATAVTVLILVLLHWSGNGSPFSGLLLVLLIFPTTLFLVGLEAEDREIVGLVRRRLTPTGAL
jgi:O-antigen/teichoic acid export membrane protein